VKTGNIFLVTGEPIQRFSDQNLEFASLGCLQHLLVTRAEGAGAAHCAIRKGLYDLPAIALRNCETNSFLILDRLGPLQVAAEP
jgi:hypothetical protein